MVDSAAPVAARVPSIRTFHGDTVTDNYEWLRDKESDAVLDHLRAENDFTDAQTAHLAPLRDTIFTEIKDRTLETDLSVPTREGDWWYYSRSVEGQQYSLHCRAAITDPDSWTPPTLVAGEPVPGEQILLDGNLLAEGAEFFSLGSFDVSRDGNVLLYGVDLAGDERYTLHFRDLRTGTDLPDTVEGTSEGAFLSPDGSLAYFTTVDDAWRPDTLWRHTVGDTAPAITLFHEPDEGFWLGAGLTRSGRYLAIVSGSSVTSEWWLVDLEQPDAEATIVWPRESGVEYEVEHAVIGGADTLLIVHNRDAENFELVAAPVADPTATTVVLPHDPAVRLESVDAFARFLAFEYRRDGLTRVAVTVLDETSTVATLTPVELRFDDELFSVGTGGNPEWEQPTLRFGFGSFIQPAQVFDLDVATGERTLLKEQPVLGGFDSADYEQVREWVSAADGTLVPLSIVRRRGIASPGPVLLYGYGSYESSMDPGFSISRLSLLDRGVTFALAHVRGGGEMGRFWYEDGKKLNKINSFTDFVSCARHLIDTGRTTPDQLVAEGGSAGGLLMGAVANLAPEQFAGIIAEVPFVDPLTSILDPELPLTVIEWDEWGNPLEDPEVYAYMRSYSPYENVREDARYPKILAVTSLNDTRVLYVEPAKWVARLREVGAPALLKTEMVAGHGGVSGRYNAWRERAFELAWILDTLGASELS